MILPEHPQLKADRILKIYNDLRTMQDILQEKSVRLETRFALLCLLGNHVNGSSLNIEFDKEALVEAFKLAGAPEPNENDDEAVDCEYCTKFVMDTAIGVLDDMFEHRYATVYFDYIPDNLIERILDHLDSDSEDVYTLATTDVVVEELRRQIMASLVAQGIKIFEFDW